MEASIPTAEPSYEQGALGRTPSIGVVIAVVVSVAAHVGLGLLIYDRPLGYVDPSAMQQDRAPIRIKRASVDTFVPPAVTGPGSEGPGDVESLAGALLAGVEPEVPQVEPDVDPRLRDTPDTRPDAMTNPLDVELPPFELPQAAVEELQPDRPQTLGYQDSPLQGTDVAPPTGAATARAALGGAGTGRAGGDGPRRPPLDDGPLVRDIRPVPTAGRATDPTAPPDVMIDLGELEPPIPEPANPPVSLDNDFEYRVTRYQRNGEPGYFRVDITAKRSLRRLRAMPKDVVYLIDTSSSVPQGWVKEAVRGVEASLPALNEGDRFNIVMFNQAPTALSTQRIQPVNAQTLEAAREFLGGAQSEGWTDVNAALRRLLVRDTTADRAYVLVLISDGKPTRGVLDTRDLINLITRDNDLTAGIYCVGIGDEQNRELLDFLAYRNKGVAVHVKRQRDAAAAINDLMSRLRYPLIKDVGVGFVGLDRGTVFPLNVPDIHQAQTFSVFGRYDADAPERFTMRLSGLAAEGAVDFTFTRALAEQPMGDKQIAQDWAFWKLHHLYSEIIRLGEQDELLRQIDELRRKYKLKTLY